MNAQLEKAAEQANDGIFQAIENRMSNRLQRVSYVSPE